MLPISRKTHCGHIKKPRDCGNNKNHKQIKTQEGANNNVNHQQIYISTREAEGHAAQKTASTSASSLFPGTMTTETTVSKGQEFFSPGQTEGETGGGGGDINWEHCSVTVVVVDTAKMDNVPCLNEEFYGKTLCNRMRKRK